VDDEEADRAARLADRLREQVPARVPEVEVVGDPLHRLPHTLTFSAAVRPR
jgi:cysteine desulfurase